MTWLHYLTTQLRFLEFDMLWNKSPRDDDFIVVHCLSALRCMNARKRITSQSCKCYGLIFSWAECLFKVFIDAFNSFVHVYRSHIHLHLGDCPQRVVKCTVKGCHNFYALEEEAEHDKQYQESHQVLLKQEVERLRGIIFDQVGDVRPIVKRRWILCEKFHRNKLLQTFTLI